MKAERVIKARDLAHEALEMVSADINEEYRLSGGPIAALTDAERDLRNAVDRLDTTAEAASQQQSKRATKW